MTKLYIAHIYEAETQRLCIFVTHSDPGSIKLMRRQYSKTDNIAPINLQTTLDIPSKTELMTEEEYSLQREVYEQEIQSAISIYIQSITADKPVSEFFICADCNLGYPGNKKFPSFLLKPSCFSDFLATSLSIPSTTDIHHIKVNRVLFSGDQSTVDDAKHLFKTKLNAAIPALQAPPYTDSLFAKPSAGLNESISALKGSWTPQIATPQGIPSAIASAASTATDILFHGVNKAFTHLMTPSHERVLPDDSNDIIDGKPSHEERTAAETFQSRDPELDRVANNKISIKPDDVAVAATVIPRRT